MASTRADVPTAHGSRYLQQLCKHWSHRFEVEFDAEKGLVRFPAALVRFEAGDEVLAVTIEGESAEGLDQLKGVVASHLDRFAFREAPLPFAWVDAPAA